MASSSTTNENNAAPEIVQASASPTTHFTFLSLPPEIRNIVYEHAFPQQDFRFSDALYPQIHRMYPGDTFDKHVAEFIDFVGKETVPRNYNRATALANYSAQQVRRRCGGCSKRLKSPSLRQSCWKCKPSSDALLLVSKQIHAECLPVRMSALRPNLYRSQGMLDAICYFRSRNIHVHIKELSFRIDIDVGSFAPRGLIVNLPDVGELLRAFPQLKRLHVLLGLGRIRAPDPGLTDLAGLSEAGRCAPDVQAPTRIQRLVKSWLSSSQQHREVFITLEMRGLLLPGTLEVINDAFKNKQADLGGFSIVQATRQFLLDPTEVE